MPSTTDRHAEERPHELDSGGASRSTLLAMTTDRMTTAITLDDIEALAGGAWILGTGGGGSPYLGLLNMRRLYAEGYRVELMSPLDLADDDRVAIVSNMG